jgi:hypothetical protein
MGHRQLLVAALVLLASAFVRAADEPEQVYAKLHAAVLAGNVDEMKKQLAAEKAAQLGSPPTATEQMMLNFMRSILPKSYRVQRKTVDGDRATLVLAGEQPGQSARAPGKVTLVRERGEWKVDSEHWGTDETAAAAPARKAQPIVQASLAPIPGAPAQGEVNGVRFAVRKAYVENGILHLRQGEDFFADQEFVVFMFLDQGRRLDDLKFNVAGEGELGDPHVHLRYKVPNKSLPETEMFMRGYEMWLEFGKQTGNSITGRIHLRLPTKVKSYVVGTFDAEIK